MSRKRLTHSHGGGGMTGHAMMGEATDLEKKHRTR